jgi:hypothetical protein
MYCISTTIHLSSNLSKTLNVSLDYLVSDEDKQDVLDIDMVKRIKKVQNLNS